MIRNESGMKNGGKKTANQERNGAGMKQKSRWKNLLSAAAPEGSLRRFGLKAGFYMLRHPKAFRKLLSPRRIRHFLFFLREEGPGFAAKRMDEHMQGTAAEKIRLAVSKINEKKAFLDYERLVFKEEKQPLVSVVIPAYNQFACTYHCLRAVLEHTGHAVSYEVILADDASSDDTRRIGELVENIRIVTNAQNQSFLKNCNHAAKMARGKYLMFLNNDTQVQKNWLQPLVRLLERYEKIGMAGSRLVYADGSLQEAGGIVWSDGSAWNYGNGQNPQDPQFCYVKETDYISGAAILVRTSLWEQIGGFDEQFAPAYYEDTDFAFEVRKRGYLVVYQPRSVVVHFEGTSNGRDPSSGLKAYQERNRQKFYGKWKEVLAAEQKKNGEHVFLARERGALKKYILFIDHYVPAYDKDAGSRCMYDYMRLFVKMGWQVKFIGDNFARSEPYTTRLQQTGIEVLYGSYLMRHWKEWLEENGRYFDYVVISRPHIADKYMDTVRACSRAKVIYFGHDLHYLREMREWRLNGNRQALRDAREWKKMEFAMMRKADISYYLSQAELDTIAKEDPSIRTRCVPIHIYNRIADGCYQAADRKDLLFVGGFGHPPNVDAVKWLGEEIMPYVWSMEPELILHVVGAGPPEEIRALACERMVLHGYLSDAELDGLYRKVRLAVVPLRFGAGIKGKIIESMMRGLPVLTTETGIEGIGSGISSMECMAEVCGDTDARGIAQKAVQLYRDCRRLEQMSAAGRRYIRAKYSVEHAVRVLSDDFDFGSSTRRGAGNET